MVRQLLATGASPLTRLTERGREVLAMMAQGHGNSEIADRLVVTERAVHQHVGNIFMKLALPPEDSGHRRVLAVLTYLGAPHRPRRTAKAETDAVPPDGPRRPPARTTP